VNWDHLRTMLWLRWRLTRNQWSRGGELNAVITMIAVCMMLVMALAGGIGGLLAGALAFDDVKPPVMGFIWDGLALGFLFFWSLGLVTELQRSEMIDLSKLLHLPVSLRSVFVLNYVSSCVSLSLALGLAAMSGLTVGLVWSRGWTMILLFPVMFGFFFMVTAWTYCLRGWLAALMVNQRRRRAVIMGVTMVFVMVAQLPNLILNFGSNRHPRTDDPAHPGERQARAQQQAALWTPLLEQAHRWVPVLWLPHGAKALAAGHPTTALWGAAGGLLLGGLGLRRAYRSTLNFYQGGNGNVRAKTPVAPRPDQPRKTLLVERELPWLPEQAVGLAMACFRSMTRAPEVKMALALNVFIFGIMGASFFLRGTGEIPEPARPFLTTASVLVAFLGLSQVLFNQFGFDRDGFRALVLIPAPRRYILLGKNLGFLPLAGMVFGPLLTLMAFLAHPPVSALVAALFQFCAAYLGLSAMGNLVSILVPFRIAAGSLKPTKMKATTTLLMMGIHMLFPVAICPILIPPGLGLLGDHFWGLPAGPINLAGSIGLAALAGVLYALTLEPLGRLLQRREQRVLAVVTQEVE